MKKEPTIDWNSQSLNIDKYIREDKHFSCNMGADCELNPEQQMTVHFEKYETSSSWKKNVIGFMYAFVDDKTGRKWTFYRKDINWTKTGFYLTRYDDGTEKYAEFKEI